MMAEVKRLLLAQLSRRWTFISLGSITLGCAVAFILWQLPPPDPLAPRFAQLELGMPLEKVTEIMGSPGFQRGEHVEFEPEIEGSPKTLLWHSIREGQF